MVVCAQVRKIVAAAMQDILTPQELFKGIKMTLGTNEAAQLIEPDRSLGSSLDAKSIPKLTVMSERLYEYDSEGKFKAIVLRQQTGLGSGLRVTCTCGSPRVPREAREARGAPWHEGRSVGEATIVALTCLLTCF